MSGFSFRPSDGPGAPHTPPGGPPQDAPSPEVFARMGQDNIFRLCADFYAELERSELRPLFPPDMKKASEKLAAFLTGLLGGPPLYHQRHGPPRMRARHLPFAIDERARRVWLDSFLKVLGDGSRHGFPPEHLPGFKRFLESFSAWMVNKL